MATEYEKYIIYDEMNQKPIGCVVLNQGNRYYEVVADLQNPNTRVLRVLLSNELTTAKQFKNWANNHAFAYVMRVEKFDGEINGENPKEIVHKMTDALILANEITYM